MKKYILLLGCVALALGATSRGRAGGVPSLVGGGTPRFSEQDTWCAVGDTEAVCRLKVVGVGRKQDALITLDVLARRVFSCVNANGQVVTEYTEKQHIGTRWDIFRAGSDGVVESSLRGTVAWAGDDVLECGPGFRVVAGSESTETSWQLTAVGQKKKAGLFNAAYTSM